MAAKTFFPGYIADALSKAVDVARNIDIGENINPSDFEKMHIGDFELAEIRKLSILPDNKFLIRFSKMGSTVYKCGE